MQSPGHSSAGNAHELITGLHHRPVMCCILEISAGTQRLLDCLADPAWLLGWFACPRNRQAPIYLAALFGCRSPSPRRRDRECDRLCGYTGLPLALAAGQRLQRLPCDLHTSSSPPRLLQVSSCTSPSCSRAHMPTQANKSTNREPLSRRQASPSGPVASLEGGTRPLAALVRREMGEELHPP